MKNKINTINFNDKVFFINSDLPLITSSGINSLSGEILNFQTNETDLEIQQIIVSPQCQPALKAYL